MATERIESLVEVELEAIADLERRSALRRLLIRPVRSERTSAYVPGTFTCWRVALDVRARTELVYCHGPFADPWGCLEIGDEDLGNDAEWFGSLDDAFISRLWRGPLPPGYEVR